MYFACVCLCMRACVFSLPLALEAGQRHSPIRTSTAKLTPEIPRTMKSNEFHGSRKYQRGPMARSFMMLSSKKAIAKHTHARTHTRTHRRTHIGTHTFMMHSSRKATVKLTETQNIPACQHSKSDFQLSCLPSIMVKMLPMINAVIIISNHVALTIPKHHARTAFLGGSWRCRGFKRIIIRCVAFHSCRSPFCMSHTDMLSRAHTQTHGTLHRFR